MADGGFEIVGPVEHGEAPITAVHDPGLLAFLRDAWAEARAAGHPYDFLAPETIRSIHADGGHVGRRRARAARTSMGAPVTARWTPPPRSSPGRMPRRAPPWTSP